MEATLHDVLLASENTTIPESGSWVELAMFLNKGGYKLEKRWLTPHVEIELESDQRESYVLHYSNIERRTLRGYNNKILMIKDIPTVFASHNSGCYFVGTKDCRDLRPGIVPARGNNIIVYRSFEAVNLAHQGLGATQGNAVDLDPNDEEFSSDLTSNSPHTPSTPASQLFQNSQHSLQIAD